MITKENAENRPKYIDKRITGLTSVIIVVKKQSLVDPGYACQKMLVGDY